MKKLLFWLLIPSLVFAQDWGGTTLRDHADSIDCTLIRDTPNDTLNYGANPSVAIAGASVPTTPVSVTLLRIDRDPRTSGDTQDTVKWYIWYDSTSSDPTTAPNYVWLYGHVMNTDWLEGDKQGDNASSGDCNWSAAFTKTDGTDSVAWSAPGAQGPITDRSQFPVCSVKVLATTPTGYLTFTTYGATNVDNMFTYGMQFRTGPSDLTFPSIVNINADDHVTESRRPYAEGWETTPTTGVGPWGAGTVGAKTTGP